MIKKEVLKQVVRDFHTRPLPELHPRATELPTDIRKIVTVTGVRRSGKTSLMYQTIGRLTKKASIEKILYFNFEDERLDLNASELDMILQAFSELYPDTMLSECYFFFDEIQNVPGWERFIRRIDETVTRNIFITGSNARLLGSDIATALRGRTIRYEVYPLSFSEVLAFGGIPADPYNSQARARMVSAFRTFLCGGGYPELVSPGDPYVQRKIVQEYFDVMIYRDLIERYGTANLSALRFFIRRLVEGVGSPVSISKIYNDLKSAGHRIGKNTLYDYLDQLEAIYFVQIARKFDPSIVRQELAERKVYIIDNSFLCSLTYRHSDDYGKLLENVVAMELRKRGHDLLFAKGEQECDFIVIGTDGQPHPLQVSYDLSDVQTRRREIAGTVWASRLVGSATATIVTMDQEEEIQADGICITAVPAWKYFSNR